MSKRIILILAGLVMAAGVTFLSGAVTGCGWGVDSHGTDFWAGSNSAYCYVDVANVAAGCETAQ